MADEPAWQNSGEYSPHNLRARIIRWTKLVIRIRPIYWLQPISECFFQGFFGAWVAYYLTESTNASLIFFSSHVLVWYLIDYAQMQAMEVFYLVFIFIILYFKLNLGFVFIFFKRGKFKYNIFVCIPFWLYREFICYVLFVRGLTSSYVEWRSGTYKLKYGGRGVRVESRPKRTWKGKKVKQVAASTPAENSANQEVLCVVQTVSEIVTRPPQLQPESTSWSITNNRPKVVGDDTIKSTSLLVNNLVLSTNGSVLQHQHGLRHTFYL